MRTCSYCGEPDENGGDHPACKASSLAADLEWERVHGEEYWRRANEPHPRPRTELERRRAKATNRTKRFRAPVFARDGYKCRICGATEKLVLDHIVPISKGGCDDPSNLQTLCWSCNSRKGAR